MITAHMCCRRHPRRPAARRPGAARRRLGLALRRRQRRLRPGHRRLRAAPPRAAGALRHLRARLAPRGRTGRARARVAHRRGPPALPGTRRADPDPDDLLATIPACTLLDGTGRTTPSCQGPSVRDLLSCMCTACAPPVPCLRPACALPAPCLRPACALHEHCLCTACALRAHCSMTLTGMRLPGALLQPLRLTTHYSLLTTYHSLLTTYYSLLTTYYLPLTTYNSLLPGALLQPLRLHAPLLHVQSHALARCALGTHPRAHLHGRHAAGTACARGAVHVHVHSYGRQFAVGV